MLPTSAMMRSSAGPRHEYLRRMIRFSQMDFDSALAQMMYLCVAPEKAFREARHRKLTKNQWSRDDPAFFVLLLAQIAATCLAYYIAVCWPLTGLSPISLLKFIAYEIFAHFLGGGLLLATLFWLVANKHLHGRGHMHEVRQPMEWQYAFDIHCNGYFTMLMICGPVQLLLLPFLIGDTFAARVASNTLIALAFCAYFYVTFRGYVELPFLERQEYFLYPIFFVILCLVLSLVTSFNATNWWVNNSLLDGYTTWGPAVHPHHMDAATPAPSA